jgi:hypothetical protein
MRAPRRTSVRATEPPAAGRRLSRIPGPLTELGWSAASRASVPVSWRRARGPTAPRRRGATASSSTRSPARICGRVHHRHRPALHQLARRRADPVPPRHPRADPRLRGSRGSFTRLRGTADGSLIAHHRAIATSSSTTSEVACASAHRSPCPSTSATGSPSRSMAIAVGRRRDRPRCAPCGPVAGRSGPRGNGAHGVGRRYTCLSGRKKARSSSTKRSGSSKAAKCPPRSSSFQ